MTDWRDHDLTLARMAEQTCRRTARQELLVDHELRLTGEQTLDAAARFAGRLSSLGLARGSHVALLAPTGVRHMVAFLAAQRIGLVTCTLHARELAGSLARLLDWVDADALVCHPQYQDKARASVAGSQRRPRLISLGDETAADFAFSWSEAASAAPAPAAPVREDDLAVIVLSSGSTGTAKGVLQTHRGIVASARNGQAFASDLDTQTTALISVASSFAAWLWGTTTVLYAGGKLVLWSGFDAAQFADIVGRERPDLVPMVPTMARLLPLEVDRDPRLASIRTVPLGGEAPSRADVERLLRWGRATCARCTSRPSLGAPRAPGAPTARCSPGSGAARGASFPAPSCASWTRTAGSTPRCLREPSARSRCAALGRPRVLERR